MGSEAVTHAIVSRGSDPVLDPLREVRRYYDGVRESVVISMLPLPAGLGLLLDALHASLTKLEERLVNMQSSCVRLPDPRSARSSVWEVPVRTDPAGFIHVQNGDELLARVHRIQFTLHQADTWLWAVRAQELDTGIPVRR